MQAESFSLRPLPDRELSDPGRAARETKNPWAACDYFASSIPATLASMLDASEAASRRLLFSCSSECHHAASSRNAQSEKYHFQNRNPATAKLQVHPGEFPVRHPREPTIDPGTQASSNRV